MPAISIIIPVYNTEQYLRRCVDSVLAQTFSDFEVLLIDDGSTDTSGAICDQYAAKDARVRVFHKANGGVGSARDMGLDNAQGEYVTFSDSDDWIEVTMFEEMHDKLTSSHADFAYCDINVVSGSIKTVYNMPEFSPDKTIMIHNFIRCKMISLWRIMVKRSLFDDNQIRHPKGISFAEDYYVVMRLLFYADSICYVNNALCYYNRGNTSSITHSRSKTHEDQGRRMMLEVIQFFDEKGVYDEYAAQLCWKLLEFIQDDVLNTQHFDEFLSIHPDKAQHIWSCPDINWKIKVIMWSLTHKLRFVAGMIVWLRRAFKR